MLDKFDKNKNPFTVPENYFEGLTKDIMNSLPAKEKQVKRVVLWKKVLPWASIAAVVVAAVIAVSTFEDMPTMVAQDEGKTETTPTNENLAYNEVEDYFLFLQDEATEAMYVNVLLLDEEQ